MSSHDHELLNTSCNRIIEISPNGIIDQLMEYNDYVRSAKVKAKRAELMGDMAVA